MLYHGALYDVSLLLVDNLLRFRGGGGGGGVGGEGILKVVLGPCVQYCPCEASEQNRGKNKD